MRSFFGSWRLSIRSKTLLLIVIAVAAMGGLAAQMMDDFRERYALTRLAQAEAAISATLAMLDYQNDLAAAGVISLAQAQADAARRLREIRYSADEGYIAVLNDQFFNVVHPTLPEIDGADLGDLQDPDGRYVAREAVAIGRLGGIGTNTYHFLNPTTGELDVKTSAIARFDPWGWTLIAGVFDTRVNQTIAEMSASAALYLAHAVLVFLAVAALVCRSIVRPIKSLTNVMSRIASGALHTPIPFTDRDDEHGHMARALSVFRANALSLDEMKTELEEALRHEQDASAQQRQFLSMVSHEFRTPLAIVDGAAGALQRRRAKMSEVKIEKSLADIRHAVLRLVRLMESTLTASKLEAGTIALNRAPFDLRGLLRQLVAEREALSPQARITLDVDALPDDPNVDDGLMYSVFDNLLSNAIKYGGDCPEVSIRGWREGDRAMVAVSDNGVGIPPDELQRVGERYFRASTASGVSGTGIGLNLVKMVAEMHDGDLTIDSTIGVGSTFTVSLSVAQRTPLQRADVQVGEDQVGEGQVGEGQVGEGQVGEGQVGEGQVDGGRVDSGKVGEGKVDNGKAANAPEPLRLLVYSSAAVTPLEDADLQAIYDASHRHNRAANVTGCLVYRDGRFVQALEGAHDVVQTLFEKIAADRRHRDVVVQFDRGAAHRTFHDWMMGREAALRHLVKRPDIDAIFKRVLSGREEAHEPA